MAGYRTLFPLLHSPYSDHYIDCLVMASYAKSKWAKYFNRDEVCEISISLTRSLTCHRDGID
jgi:hypothetical protein